MVGCRVLVIDDTPANLRLVRHFLDRAGAVVTCCPSGPSGIDAAFKAEAAGEPFQVVLLDIQMPEMDGYEVARVLRERGFQAPVLAFTANTLSTDREFCLRSGFDDYVTKPIDKRTLVELVARHAAAWAQHEPDSDEPEEAASRSEPVARRLWKQLLQFATPPGQSQDPGVLRRLSLLLSVAALGLPQTLLQALLLWWVFPSHLVGVVVGLLAAIVPVEVAIILIYRRTGSASLAGHLLLAALSLQIGLVTFFSGGVGSPAAFWVAPIPMVAVALVGQRPALAWGGAMFAVLAGFFACSQAGIDIPNHLLPERVATAHIVSASLLCVEMLSLLLPYAHAQREAIQTLAAADSWLIQAQEQSSAIDRARHAIVASLGGELQTRVTSIRAAASGIERSWRAAGCADDRVAPLQAIAQNAETLGRVIEDVLEISELESGQVNPETHSFSLLQMVEELVESERPRATANGLSLSLTSESPVPPQVIGDRARTARALRCLLENALKFTPAGGVHVGMSGRQTGRNLWVSIRVTDSGPGIPPEEQTRLFDPFQQGDSSKARRYGGNGLGLALSRRTVEALGGSLTLDSELGQGSSFTIQLPYTLGPDGAWSGAVRTRTEASCLP